MRHLVRQPACSARSASRTQELRDLLVADIPRTRFVEDVELEAVITEMSGLSDIASPPGEV